MYEIHYTATAIELLRSIRDERSKKHIKDCIERLKTDPAKRGKPLKDDLQGLFSIRAAGQRYRIVYSIDDTRHVVSVIAVGLRKEGDRKDIYSLLRRLFGIIAPLTSVGLSGRTSNEWWHGRQAGDKSGIARILRSAERNSAGISAARNRRCP